MNDGPMEMAFEKTDAELKLQQVVNSITQRTQGTCIVPKHYNLQEDSSEEDELLPGRIIQEGCGDCVCCVCGKTFMFLNNLIEHFSVHTDEVRCHLCQVTFTRVISLALHLENAHAKYHLYCKSCKVKFQNTWHMNQHMEKHLEIFRNCKVEEPDRAVSPSCSQMPVDEDVKEVVIKNEEVETMYLKMEEEESEIALGKMKENDCEDNLWECAPIEEDIIKEENEENIEIKEESDSSLIDHPVYSPEKALNLKSHTDIASGMSSDCNSDANLANGLPRLLHKSKRLRTRSIQQRQTCTNTNEKPIPVEAIALGKMQERKETSITRTIDRDPKVYSVFWDHNYCRTQSHESPGDLNQAPARNTRSSTRLSVDNVENTNSNSETLHAFSNKDDTMDCKGDQQEMVEVVVLRSMPQREGMTHKGRAILQAAYEKVIKIQKLGNMPSKTEEEPSSSSSLSSSTLTALEPQQPELDIKVEDDVEDNLWECAPIEEDVIKEEDEENVKIKEESDSSLIDDPVYSPERDRNSNTDSASEADSSDSNSTAQKNSMPRLLRKSKGLRTQSVQHRLACSNTNEKPVRSVEVSAGPERETSNEKTFSAGPEREMSNEKTLSSGTFSAGPEREMSNEKTLSSGTFSAGPEREMSNEKTLSSGTFSAGPERKMSNEKTLSSGTFSAGSECETSNEKPLVSGTLSAGPEPNASIEKPLSSLKVSASPELSTLTEKILNSVKPIAGPEPGSVKDPQICSSCGLSKVVSTGKTMGRCKCMPLFTCYTCGLTFVSNLLLLKHQAETHPLTKYVCSTCLLVFPNQTSFTKHSCCSKVPGCQTVNPIDNKKVAKSPSTMLLKLVPSPALGVASKQPPNNGGSQPVPSMNIIYSNNLINIVDASQKLCTLSNSLIPVLPNNPSSTKTIPVPQVSATVTLSKDQKVTNVVLKGQDPLTSLSTATQAKTGQMQVLIPASSPASKKPAEVVLQGVVLSQHCPVPITNPARVPVRTSLPTSLTASASNQSKVALRIPTYPTTSPKVTVSFSPTPIQFPTPALVSTSGMKPVPTLTSQRLPGGNIRPVRVPLPRPVPSLLSTAASVQPHLATPVQSSINLEGSCGPYSSVKVPPSFQSPLKVVGVFVNQSHELALQKRLRQSWQSKAIFPCRHCGAIARQPALGIRHRYQYRGPRLHRCQCGKAFQRRLQLLRHQVQHAEAMRYVCAACGQTFQGTHHLACHKQKVVIRYRPSNMKKGINRECRNVFNCDCGQAFTRSSALLWHILKNSKPLQKKFH